MAELVEHEKIGQRGNLERIKINMSKFKTWIKYIREENLHSNSYSYHSSPFQSLPHHTQKHIQRAFHRFGVPVLPIREHSQSVIFFLDIPDIETVVSRKNKRRNRTHHINSPTHKAFMFSDITWYRHFQG